MGESELVQTWIDEVVQTVESEVSESWVGPPRAFFEIPVGDTIVRGVYRTYVVQAPTMREALTGLQACIQDLIAGATQRSMTTNLVWRLPEKILAENHEADPGCFARTRVVVLPDRED